KAPYHHLKRPFPFEPDLVPAGEELFTVRPPSVEELKEEPADHGPKGLFPLLLDALSSLPGEEPLLERTVQVAFKAFDRYDHTKRSAPIWPDRRMRCTRAAARRSSRAPFS